jgi:hypothetical protein
MTIRLELTHGFTKTLNVEHKRLITSITTKYCGTHQILRSSPVLSNILLSCSDEIVR